MKLSLINHSNSTTRELELGSLHDFMFDNAECRPYLRSMSSMTEEEERELTEINCQGTLAEHKYAIFYRSQDWLNKKMFDYRGLIEKGLAFEAPDGMYNIK